MVRTVYVPLFGSQQGSSQRHVSDRTMDETEPPSPRDKRGNKRGKVNVRGQKTRFVLKVKFPKLDNSTLSKKATEGETTERRWTAEATANKTKATVSSGGAGAESDSVGRDVFFFSQRPTSTATNEKEKARLAVLRTISKMLEENQLIRERLATVSQAN
ncbi:uncharacterized protein LOC144463791 [Epinephelus lanceolatus]